MTLKLDSTWNLDPFPASDQESVAYLLVDITDDGSAPAPVTTVAGSAGAPLNLSLVLDTSGSMGGAKLQNLKGAVKWVINHLSPDDTISITLFDEEVNLLIPVTRLADARGMI